MKLGASYSLDKDDVRVCDKWGDAGCIEVPADFYTEEDEKQHQQHDDEKLFLFFGWASS